MTHVDQVVLVLVSLMIAGLMVWGIDQTPVPEPVKGYGKGVVILLMALVLLRKFGLL